MKTHRHIHIARLFAILATMVAFASCEEVLDIDEDELDRPLVLNAMPSNGNRMFANFTRTHFFLDDYNRPLDGAELTLYVNQVPMKPDSVSGCNYFFDYIATAGDRLEMHASYNGETATASTYVPYMPSVSNVTARLDSTLLRMVMIRFKLSDMADYDEHYHINIVERDSGLRFNPMTQKLDTVDTVYNPYFMCYDRLITDPSVAAFQPFGGYFYQRILCSDSLINGRDYNITIMVLKLVDTNEVAPFMHDYSLNFESVTPERYDYLVQQATAQNSTALFAEPSQVRGNVDGALGVFAGTAKQLVHLDIASGLTATTPLPTVDTAAVLKAYRNLK